MTFLKEQLESTQKRLEEEQEENLQKRQEVSRQNEKVEELNAHLKRLYILYEQDQEKVKSLEGRSKAMTDRLRVLEEEKVIREDMVNELKKRNTYNEMNMHQLAQEVKSRGSEKPALFEKSLAAQQIYSEEARSKHESLEESVVSKTSEKLVIRLQVHPEYHQ